MGLFDGIIGGAVGAGLTTVLNNLLEKNGGLEGLVKQFQQQGLGDKVNSWIGTGQNKPISPDEMKGVIGSDLLAQLAQKAGIPPEQLAAKLAEVMPQAIDRVTPNGTIPEGDAQLAR